MSWNKVPLSSLVELITKGTTPTSVGYDFTDSGINFIKIESINLNGNFIKNKFAKIDKECNEALKRSQLKEGDILFSIAGALGRTAIVTKEILPANTNQALAIIRLKNSNLISKEFLIRVLTSESILNQVSLMKGGVAQQNLSLAQLKDFLIPLPSLATQQKIVAKLDAIFAEIDKATAAAEANTKNADLFFTSYLNTIFNKNNTVLLKNISEINMGQSPIGESYNVTGEGVPLINGPVEFGKDAFSKTIKTKFTTQPTKMCKEGDLILCVRGSTTGRMNIAGFDACIGRGVASIRAKDSQKWINYFIFANRNLIYSLGTGSTFPNVSSASIGNLNIFNPSLSEKNRILLNLDIAKENTDNIRIICKNKLTQLSLLKQSILQQAFSGELVKD